MRRIQMMQAFEPDVLIFSDLHLHERSEFSVVGKSGLNSRLVEGLDILDQILGLCKKRYKTIKDIVHLGDLFELKNRVPNHMLLELSRRLDLFEDLNLRFIHLMGNHDFAIETYPLPKLFSGSYFLFLDEDGAVDLNTLIGGVPSYFIPFKRDYGQFMESLQIANSSNCSLVFFHQEIYGARYESGKMINVLPEVEFDKDKMYFSGHLHNPQLVKRRVQYVGAPYQFKFGEVRDKFVWLMDTRTLEYKSLQLDYPKFVEYDWNSVDRMEKEYVENNYVKIRGEMSLEDYQSYDKEELRQNLMQNWRVKGVVFDIKTKREHQMRISEASVKSDNEIVKEFLNQSDTKLDKKALRSTGADILSGVSTMTEERG